MDGGYDGDEDDEDDGYDVHEDDDDNDDNNTSIIITNNSSSITITSANTPNANFKVTMSIENPLSINICSRHFKTFS